jgi:hypothetical protein
VHLVTRQIELRKFRAFSQDRQTASFREIGFLELVSLFIGKYHDVRAVSNIMLNGLSGRVLNSALERGNCFCNAVGKPFNVQTQLGLYQPKAIRVQPFRQRCCTIRHVRSKHGALGRDWFNYESGSAVWQNLRANRTRHEFVPLT